MAFHRCWQVESLWNLLIEIPHTILTIINVSAAVYIICTLYSKMQSHELNPEKIIKYRYIFKFFYTHSMYFSINYHDFYTNLLGVATVKIFFFSIGRVNSRSSCDSLSQLMFSWCFLCIDYFMYRKEEQWYDYVRTSFSLPWTWNGNLTRMYPRTFIWNLTLKYEKKTRVLW